MSSREDRLDALLAPLLPSSPAAGDGTDHPPTNIPEQDATSMDAHLAPLLDAAGELAQFASVRPDPTFAARLGQRMLARAEQRRQESMWTGVTTTPVSDVAALALDEQTTVSTAVWPGRVLPWRETPQRSAMRRVLIAAVALMALGIGTWTAAMALGAIPGSAFYGLHQIGQNVSLNFMDQRERAQSHIQAAREWLADLRADASGQGDASAYGATLSAMLGEDTAAAQVIQQMAPGGDRDVVSAQLAALRTDERTTLRAALPHISWSDRLATTQALAALGVTVPHITSATVTQARGLWRVTLQGSGFEPGAVLLFDGKPLGSVTAVSSTTLTAQAPSGPLANRTATLGVENPDGTVATTTAIALVVMPTATPNPNGNGSGSGGNSGSGHGNSGH